jgi:hypothetical protein
MTALRRRLPVLVGAVSAALAVVLAVAAVLLAVQSAPTETVAQARTHLTELVLGVAGAGEPVVGEGAACPWLGIGPTSRQVRPRVELHLPGGPTGVLDAAARSGEIVARGAAGGEVVLVGESPCVWPSGTRTP